MTNVKVSDWSACYNSGDDILAVSCTVTTDDGSAAISAAGLILNNAKGMTLASAYTAFSGGSDSVSPAMNVPPSGLSVGDTVSVVASGQAGGEHYFFEQKLTIGEC